MISYTKEKKSLLLKVFLFVTVLFSLWDIYEALVVAQESEYKPGILSLIIALFLVSLSVFCFINFKKQNFHKITLVLPLINIVVFVVAFLAGLAIGIIILARGLNTYQLVYTSIPLTASILLYFFELFFALYLIYIFRK